MQYWHRAPTFEFLPAMPPRTVSGKVMRAQMTRMMQIVPNGSAAVDCACHKTPSSPVHPFLPYMPSAKAAFHKVPAVLVILCLRTEAL